MVYRKRSFKKRRVRVNKTKKLVTGEGPTLLERLAGQASNIGTVAKAVLPIAAAINTEFKYFDVSSSGSASVPGTNDSLVSLTNGVAQGTTDVTRIGNSILAKNIAIKWNGQLTCTAGTQAGFARVILFVWKENLQANAPTAAKLFETPAAFLSGFNKDYTDQFVILKDKVIPMAGNIAAAVNGAPKTLKIFKKLDFHQRYQAGAANDGTVNHIYMMIRCNNPAVNQLVYELYSRLNFTDN